MNKKFQAIILAAGRSTRFPIGPTKLVFPIQGMPLIQYTMRLVRECQLAATLVVGHAANEVIAQAQVVMPDVTWVVQPEQRGTGDALARSQEQWAADNVVVLNADVPGVTPEILHELMHVHTSQAAALSFVTATYPDDRPHAYGRVMSQDGMLRIIEAHDYTGTPAEGRRFNAGIYCIDTAFARRALERLKPSRRHELYITDLVHIAGLEGLHVATLDVPASCVEGVNTLPEALAWEQRLRQHHIEKLIGVGVYVSDAQTVHIDQRVVVGGGTRIAGNVQLLGNTRIGARCTIGAGAVIQDSCIEDDVIILPYSVITDAVINSHAQIGPFAHIRRDTTVGSFAVVGNFVETVHTTLGAHSKAKHLSYLGNSKIGQQVNIGAGTVICNYDGRTKHETSIADGAFIGSNSSLIAPVTIGKQAIVAAGSTITQPVPDGALGIGRAFQVNKPDYRARQVARDVARDTVAVSQIKIVVPEPTGHVA